MALHKLEDINLKRTRRYCVHGKDLGKNYGSYIFKEHFICFELVNS